MLREIPDEELERLMTANNPILPEIEARTGLRRKDIVEVLVLSDFLLESVAEGSEEEPLPLDEFLDRHCERVAEEVELELYDVKTIFITRTEVMLESHEKV